MFEQVWDGARDAWGVFGVAVWLMDEEFDGSQCVPGPALGQWLALMGEDLDSVPDEQLPVWSQAAWRQNNHTRGLLLTYIAKTGERATDAFGGFGERGDVGAHEVAIPLHMSPRAAGYELDRAYRVVERLPALGAAMLAGDLDEVRAVAFAEGTTELPDDLAREVVAELLERSFTMAVPRLKSAIVEVALALDPNYGDRVYAAAVRRIDVRGRGNTDGTASVSMSNLPPEWAAGAVGRTDALAKAAKAGGDPRPIGLLRALIAVCRLDGTFDGMDGDAIVAYLYSTRPDPQDPDPGLPKPRSHPPRRAGAPAPAHTRSTDPHDPGSDGGGEPGSGGSGSDGSGSDRPGGPAGGPACAQPEAEAPPVPGPVPEPGIAPGPEAEPAAAEPDVPSRADATSPDAPGGPGGVPVAFSRGTGMVLRVELATLLGLNSHPGELPGWSPVGPARAGELVAEYAAGEWCWTVTDTDGYLLRAGTTRARPHGHRARDGRCEAVVELLVPQTLLHRLLQPDADGLPVDPRLLARWLPVLAGIAAGLAADPPPPPDPRRRLPGPELRREVCQAIPYCIGAYCATPSRRAEIDHLHDHARGGDTVFANLCPMCKPTHRLKTVGALRVQRTGPWSFMTTTPLGAAFTVTSLPLIDVLPDPRPTVDPGPAPPREHPGYHWSTDDPWDTWIPKPRPSRDWVATRAAALRAKQQTRHRPRAWPPPPRPAHPDDEPPPF